MFAKNNRGQVTLFIIIGLLVLFSVTTYLLFQNENTVTLTSDDLITNLEFTEVTQHIQYCLQTVSEDAVVINGLKGGLYNPEKFVFGFLRPPITTYYKKGNLTAPFQENVAYSIGLEFLDLMPACLDEFNGTQETLEYDQDYAEVTVRIVEQDVVFAVDYPITSSKAQRSRTFSRFTHTVENVRLSTILDLATELSYLQQTDPGFICVSCVVELADQNFMYIDFTDIGDNKTVYTFTDLFSSINDEPYVFMMAHEH